MCVTARNHFGWLVQTADGGRWPLQAVISEALPRGSMRREVNLGTEACSVQKCTFPTSHQAHLGVHVSSQLLS